MRLPAVLLMLASGFAGLGYQIAWTQQSALWMGHESAAMLAIVAAFFGGMSVGAWWSGRRIDASARPAAWYAGCEVVIGLWGLMLIFLMAPASRLMLSWIGPEPSALWQWSVVFGGSFLLLLPATAAMGATLPAMERVVSVAGAHSRPIALLYGANTLGALCGVLLSAFVLVPRFGYANTAAVCVALNLGCALIAAKMSVPRSAPAPAVGRRSGALLTLFFTGLLGIGYEVLVARALNQVAENTIFTFAILLAVYLAGTALGAFVYARGWLARFLDSRERLLQLQAWTCLAGIGALIGAETMKVKLASLLGTGMAPALLIEWLLAGMAFLLPTLVMGALFSFLVSKARESGANPGKAIGVNTLGAALAPAVFGVWLLPAVGITYSLLIVSGSYLLMSARGSWISLRQLAPAAAVVAMALWKPPIAALHVPEGGRVLTHAEGISATVSIVEGADGVATLHINNRQQEGSSATQYADARQALLPLLLHPDPRRALFLGLGTGATARAATLDPDLQVDAVELLPEVIAASDVFAQLQDAAPPPRLRLVAADARRFVRSAPERYDLVVSDNFHPARSGSAALYTVEHFEAVRSRLDAGGVFCQWLPLHQLDLDTLRSIVASYRKVFPNSWLVLATHSLDTPVIGLIARRDGENFDPAAVRSRLENPGIAEIAARFGFDDDFALFGLFVAGSSSLGQFSSDASLNTDDHPVVAWIAPRITYSADSAPRDRLVTLLGDLTLQPQELLADARDDAWNLRLAAYWRARNLYIDAGRSVQPSNDVSDMLSQVRAPLLSVLEISPDFRPAYEPLVMMARELGRTHPSAARELLAQLAHIQPGWHEAGDALAELGRD